MSNLRTWAAANAPAVDPSVTTPVSTIMTDVATSLLMLWPTLRADPAMAPGDRQLIDDWIINRLVAIPGTTPFITFPNDLGEWAAEIAMADSIRRSDNANFAYAIQRFYGSLLQMRTDGSFPLSARLSACSAVYSNADLIHLTAIAEMAATQGYDLYHLTVDGKSLETGIQFFLNAYQNPDLLYQYSKAGFRRLFRG